MSELDIDLDKSDRNIARAIDSTGDVDQNLIRLSSGVVLRAKQANPHVLIRIMTATPRPTPPMYFNEAMGRYLENPADPDYIKQVEAWEIQYSNGMLNALIGLGTELVSVPKGMQTPKDEIWLKDYQAMGLAVHPESPSWRYITWVLFLAAPTKDDTTLLSSRIKALSGVKEADVRDATNFPASDKTG